MREYLINQLKKEIVGPGLEPNEQSPYKDDITGEEILLNYVHGAPIQRYGAGILFPQEITDEIQNDNLGFEENENEGNILITDDDDDSQPKRIVSKETNEAIEAENDDEVSSLANQLKPSAMGLTFRCKNNGVIKISVRSARYEKGADQKQKWQINNNDQLEAKENQDYFIRRPLKIDPISVDLSSIDITSKEILKKVIYSHNNVDWLQLRINNRSTRHDLSEGLLILTVSIVNLKIGNPNLNSLFQNEISISTENTDVLVPYRDKIIESDSESSELNLLYRKRKMFGIGHGCAVTWQENEFNENSVNQINTSVLPVYEIPLIASNDNESIPMFILSDLCSEEEWKLGKDALRNLQSDYLTWIENLQREVQNWTHNPNLNKYKIAAEINIQKCLDNYKRINTGIELITNENTNKELIRCFRWMNSSMLWQQQRSKIPLRKWRKVQSKIKLDDIQISDLKSFHNSGKGKWRPFQLAFVLMNINSIWNEKDTDRNILDLIWFPTGGGKTEAYLGLTSFQIFTRRIKAIIDGGFNHKRYSGTTVLMRYTLRLLTIQQYERASSLICACELIRQKELPDLGSDPISIGLWVGGKSTPNENSGDNGAVNQFNLLRNRNDAEYHFVLMKCPCCGTQIGKLDNDVRSSNDRVRGLKIANSGSEQRVVFKCENPNCETSKWEELPLYVVDEDIFRNKPTLLIGTVDKFAMLVWKAGTNGNNEYSYLQAGSIFGFRYDSNNSQVYRILPPQLIIQDELHLISGPLGTIVGLYETMIQTLCNNYLQFQPPFDPSGDFIPPKIIASSATISRANEQTKNLYGIDNDNLNIFPPQGIEFGETWFSNVISPNEKPGRKYLGILAPGYKSIQTAETRVYSRLLQESKISSFSDEEKNFYWTLVGYFNSIRGLGSASTLINSDISQYLKTLFNRELVIDIKKRKPGDIRFMELTSRMDDSEIPRILKILESPFPGDSVNRPLDICFATNMIATGVDVSRLGIMIVHGQPKTTAEYIQASSRVGRDIQFSNNKYIGQGLAVTIYSPTKPRDKSHYEQFQSYHSRIYSNVEPTSVTPFSINARERALHSIFIGLIRHFSHGNLRHRPDGDDFLPLANSIKNIIVSRAGIVDNIEQNKVITELDNLIDNWTNSGIQAYGDAMNIRIMRGERVLMYSASAEIPPGYLRQNSVFPLKVNTSMRGVDFESNLESIQQ